MKVTRREFLKQTVEKPATVGTIGTVAWLFQPACCQAAAHNPTGIQPQADSTIKFWLISQQSIAGWNLREGQVMPYVRQLYELGRIRL